ncbi:MAG: FAD binding domain-containing protein, partial [Dongiaceae bacterium]
MKSFEYAAPDSVKEATALLEGTWGKTEVLAGGTDLVTCLKQHLTAPERVVSLKNIKELRGIRNEKAGLRIGAMTTLAHLAGHKTVQAQFPALVTAVRGIGSPQLINVGTVGGDLCQRPRCWYFRNGFGLFGEVGGESLVRAGDNRYHAIFGTADRSRPLNLQPTALFVSASSLGPPLM